MKHWLILIYFLGVLGLHNMADYPVQLSWDTHFLAKPDLRSPYYAVTSTTWQYSYVATITQKRLHIDFNFSAGVDPTKSWVKLNKLKTAAARRKLLHHEQGHADLNFLQLKDGERSIGKQSYTINNYKKAIREQGNKLSDYYNKLQQQYDKESQHGADDAGQKKWDNWIKQELNKYQD